MNIDEVTKAVGQYWNPMVEEQLFDKDFLLKDLPKRKVTAIDRIRWKAKTAIVRICEWIISRVGY